MVKLLFDKYKVAAVFVANTAVLSLYATGSVTGIALECGQRNTTLESQSQNHSQKRRM